MPATPWLRRIAALLAVVAVLAGGAPASVSRAEDVSTLHKDLATGGDFRVRVTAALALGKIKDPSSVGPLSRALSDSQGAVRAAAAAALGSLGDPSAIAALEGAKQKEDTASVKNAIEATITKLKNKSKTKFLVTVGRLENKSGNPKMSQTFTAAAKSGLSRLPGVEIVTDSSAVAESQKRKLPLVALDGRLVQLEKANSGADVGYSAKVEFIVRKLPEQSLKGSVKGNAQALANGAAVRTDKQVTQLQNDAVNAAVEKALEAAPTALEAATK
jgi:hypothetical protein